MCIQMIKKARAFLLFIDNDQEKVRRHICAIIKEAEELGCCRTETRKRGRNGERTDRNRREARDNDLITLQKIGDDMIDRRKGSGKEVKNQRKEPNSTKGPRAVKSEEVSPTSEDETERQ